MSSFLFYFFIIIIYLLFFYFIFFFILFYLFIFFFFFFILFFFFLLSTAMFLTFSLFRCLQFYYQLDATLLLHSNGQAVHIHLATYWYVWSTICNLYEIVCILYQLFSFLYSCLYSRLLSFFSYLYCDSSQFYTENPFNIEAVHSLLFDKHYFTTSQYFFF